jgi:hypothetical protein
LQKLALICWPNESWGGAGREMGVVVDWIIFLMVVALMIYVVNPLLILLLWMVGGP